MAGPCESRFVLYCACYRKPGVEVACCLTACRFPKCVWHVRFETKASHVPSFDQSGPSCVDGMLLYIRNICSQFSDESDDGRRDHRQSVRPTRLSRPFIHSRLSCCCSPSLAFSAIACCLSPIRQLTRRHAFPRAFVLCLTQLPFLRRGSYRHPRVSVRKPPPLLSLSSSPIAEMIGLLYVLSLLRPYRRSTGP
jgi:hypothetical protein